MASPGGRRSVSAVFADSYSVGGSESPEAGSSSSGRSPRDELLSPRQTPTSDFIVRPASVPDGHRFGYAVTPTRFGIETGDGVSTGKLVSGVGEEWRGSQLTARTPRATADGFGADGAGGTGGPAVRISGAQHLRRRSSMSNLQTSLLMDDIVVDRTAKTTPSSAGMERATSLTTFMSGGGHGANRAAHLNDRAREKRAERAAREGSQGRPVSRRRLYASLLRLTAIVSLGFAILLITKRILYPQSAAGAASAARSKTADGPARAPWLERLQDASLLFDSLETVPYPITTHPRSPSLAERSSLPLSDYLLTRLGSHFSFPSKNLDEEGGQAGSQLWLTTATADSVKLANRHLNVFFQRLNSRIRSTDIFTGSSNASYPEENKSQRTAQRTLVTLCRDAGCMEYCRAHPDLFCYGGFVPHRNSHDPLDKAGLNAQNADEIAKLRAILETLQTGRRVFWIDDGTYLRRDPVPYMGDLAAFDLQIPVSWSTGNTNTGVAVFNPSQRLIGLFRKMLDIARLPLLRDRSTWASTNLLLDPKGQFRNYEMTAPRHAPALDENLFEDDPSEQGGEGMPQADFESMWDGGLDVHVLDRRHFSSSTGRLGMKRFAFEQQKADDLLYFHCECCGDPYTQDYIAGALGYHQPSVTYDLAEGETLPRVPLVLKAGELEGTTEELRQAMSLLLQVAAETGRAFVPPLTATVVDADGENRRQMYIWRVFPIALWAHPGTVRLSRLPDRVKLPPTDQLDIREPAFVMHAAEYLRSTAPGQLSVSRLVAELTETVGLDLGDGELTSLEVLIARLKRPFWSTERIVALENFSAVRDKADWAVDPAFSGVTMCDPAARPTVDGGGGKTCGQLCPL